jgi:hypothetical protein
MAPAQHSSGTATTMGPTPCQRRRTVNTNRMEVLNSATWDHVGIRCTTRHSDEAAHIRTLQGHGQQLKLRIRYGLPLRGSDRITVRKLPPGQSIMSPLRVQADPSGRYELTSPNFSYRDHNGVSHRESGFTAEIMVDPEPGPMPEPEVAADVETAELPLG